jgi:hypothetical protein
MKNNIFTVLILTVSLGLFFSVSGYSQSSDPGERVNQAITTLLDGFETFKSSEEGKGLLTYGFSSISGSFLQMGEKSFVQTTLTKGTEYLLMAGGDDKTFDVDIIIKDSDGKVVKRDIKSEKFAVLYYEPLSTGLYVIELSASGVTGYGFSVLCFLQDGANGDVSSIKSAMTNMKSRWDKVASKFSITFASDPEALNGNYDYRSFCWNGYFVSSGSNYGFNKNGVSLNKYYLIIASGDDNAQKLDMDIKYDNKKEYNMGDEITPFVLFTPKTLREYDFTTYNKKSYGDSFIVTCLFEVTK